MTEHEYEDGRLVRSVTTREPRWTEQDRAEVLALALYRRDLCPCGCGHPVRDSTGHEDGGARYQADWIRCRARDALLLAQEELKEIDRPQALMWQVHRTG